MIGKKRTWVVFVVCLGLLGLGTASANEAMINGGTAWLSANQQGNGSWGGEAQNPATVFQSTSQALRTLAASNTQPAYDNGLVWMDGQSPAGVDSLARKVFALSGTAHDVSADADTLAYSANADGGWGLDAGLASDVLDTSLALLALSKYGWSVGTVQSDAATWLLNSQNGDGSWGLLPGEDGHPYYTALVVDALLSYVIEGNVNNAAIDTAITDGCSWLVTFRNPDGGWGDPASTVFESGLAGYVLALASHTFDYTGTKVFLQNSHAANSWNANSYETAIGVRALSILSKSNLTLAASDISFLPAMPIANEAVAITATVRNFGLEAVSNVVVRFFDGDPDGGGVQIGADQSIAGLAANTSAKVGISQSWPVNGTYPIYVRIDPADAISETSETDNTAFNNLFVVVPAPDLSVVNTDVAANPIEPDQGQNFTVTAAIDNIGRLDAANVVARFFHGDPDAGGVQIGTDQTVATLAAGASTQVQVTVSLANQGIQKIYVRLDPAGTIAESREDNNTAWTQVNVQPVPDLSISPADLTFDPASPAMWQTFTLELVVHNVGAAKADSHKISVWKGDPDAGGTLLVEWTLSHLYEADQITLPAPVSISESGTFTITARVDSANDVAEISEANNQAEKSITVKAVSDLSITPGDILTTPAFARPNEDFVIWAGVRNLGDQDAANVDVRFFNGDPDAGGVQIGVDQTVALIAGGGSAVVSLTHQIAVEGSYDFYVVADPDDTVAEHSNDNNEASKTVLVAGQNPFPHAATFVAWMDYYGRIYVAESNGDGTWQPRKYVWRLWGNYARGITVNDFDNDGDLDIVAGCQGASNTTYIYFLENNGANQFAHRGRIGSIGSSGNYAMDMTSGDFNNDGYQDFVCQTNSTNTGIFLGTSDPMVYTRTVLSWGSSGRGIDIADFDRDGNLDLMAARYDGHIYFRKGNGDGTFAGGVKITDVGTDPYGLCAADFNNDGHADFIVNNGSAGDTGLWLGNGDGTFQAGIYVPSIDFNRHGNFDAYDFNSDGHVDFVASDYSNNRAWYYPNTGEGSFGARIELGTNTNESLAISAPPWRQYGAPWAKVEPASQDVALGANAALDGSNSKDSDDWGNIVSHDWDFGDGNTASGATVNHGYGNDEAADEGTYLPRLTVEDDDGYITHGFGLVRVLGNSPVADAGGPYNVTEASAASGAYTFDLDGTGSTDAGGIVSYEWIFGDGWQDDYSADSGLWTPAAGTWGVLTGVYRQTNESDGRTRNFAGDRMARDYAVEVDVEMKSGTGQEVQLLFRGVDNNNCYEFILRGRGYNDTLFYEVINGSGNNRKEYDLPFTVQMNQVYHLKVECRGSRFLCWVDDNLVIDYTDGSYAYGKVGLSTYKTHAEFDNFSVTFSESGPTPQHTSSAGSYPVTLTVTDSAGQVDSDVTTINVLPGAPPVSVPGVDADLTENDGLRAQWTVHFDASGSSDDVGIISYDWDFGDGSIGTGVDPMHTFTPAGFPASYTVTLTVTDNALQTHTQTMRVNIDIAGDNPPTADPAGPYVVNEESAVAGIWTVYFDGSGSTDDLGIQRYEWQFGDGGTATTWHGKDRVSMFEAGTRLYGYDVNEAGLRVIATQSSTNVRTRNLETGAIVGSTTLNRYQEWTSGAPGDNSPFVVEADKPVVAYLTDGGSHSAFIPALDGSCLGSEFIFRYYANQGFYVYAFEDAIVRFYNTGGTKVAEKSMDAGTYWNPGLGNTIYHVKSTGRVSMQTVGNNGYTTAASENGTGVGRLFYGAAQKGTTGAFVVFAYDDADVTVFDLDSGAQLYNQSLTAGGHWFQNSVGSKRLRFESTGDMEVWVGDTEGGTGISNLGDDISFASGRGYTDYYLHGLMDGFVVFAPYDDTDVDVDGLVQTIDADGYLQFAGGTYNHLTATKPVLVQTLGRANAHNDMGTYLGGLAQVLNYYAAPGTYGLTLTVIDHAGQEHTDSTTVTVGLSDPPLADAGGPYTANEGDATGGLWRVEFDASASTDDFLIYQILWDFDDSDGLDFNTPDATGATPVNNYAAAGTYTATVRVIDHALQATDQQVFVTVLNNDPPVADSGGPYVLGEEVAKRGVFQVTLDATASTDDFGIYRYEWDLGDAFYEDFTGTVLDTNLWQASTGVSQDGHLSITGANNWSNRYAYGKQEFVRGEGSEFHFKVYSKTGGTTQAMFGLKNNRGYYHYNQMPYAIYLYNNSFYVYEEGSNRGNIGNFSQNTWYDFKIILGNLRGAQYWMKKSSDADWTLIYNSNHATRATLFRPGITCYSGVYYMDDVTVIQKTVGARPTHAYTEPGEYTVTLTVVDNALQTDVEVTTLELSMGNPPVADAGGPYMVEPGVGLRLDASGSTDDVRIADFEWSFGDGYHGEGAGVTHWYSQPGQYTVTVRVYDNMEQWDEDTTTVTVGTGLPPDAVAGGPYEGGAGGPHVYLDGGASQDDSGIALYEWDLTMLDESFLAPQIDPTYWQTGTASGGRVTIVNGELELKGVNAWGTAWFCSPWYYKRGQGLCPTDDGTITFSGRFRVPDKATVMLGWKDNSGNYRYNDLVYGMYIREDLNIAVYEDASNRGNKGTYTIGDWHTFAITVGYSGADYYLDGAKIYSSSHSYETNLRPFIIAHSDTQYFDDLAVTAHVEGEKPRVLYGAPGMYPGTLTVTDGSGQTDTSVLISQIAENAAPQVICVPWVATDPKFPHETYNGKEITLKGVVRDRNASTYQWNFGDGTQSAVMAVSNNYDLSIRHTYPPAPDGTPFVASLTVWDTDGASSFDNYNVVIKEKTLDVEVNVAIDEALWWLHKQMDRGNDGDDGRWTYSSYYASATGSVLHAFQIHSHLESGDMADNPYVETVARGLRYLFSRVRQKTIDNETYGDPDTNGNGIGIETNSSRAIYEGGMVMMGMAATGTPLARAHSGGTNVYGRTYFDILQDMVDMYAWGQYDHATVGGGWRYSWNSGPDNSACQWAAMGLESAEKVMGVHLPQWVKDRNKVWVSYSWNGTGWGYTGAGNGIAQTPAGMSQVAMDGFERTHWYWINSEGYLAQQWDSWYNGSRNYYAMYGLAKALRIALPEEVTTMAENTPWAIDWYSDPDRGMARSVMDDQYLDGTTKHGSFKSEGSGSAHVGESHMRTAWGVVILSKTLFVKAPVADAGPDQVYGVGWELTLDGAASYHTDPFRSIVLYEWDVDGDGNYDYTSTEPTIKHTYNNLGAFEVVLRVTDDNIPPIQDTDTAKITIAVPPHAPISQPGGPYAGSAGVPVQLDGSGSFDIDPGDFITEYQWELAGGFPYDYSEASGAKPTHIWASPGTYAVGLRVWDNGVLSPGGAKLSHIGWTTVTIKGNDPPTANAGGPYTVNEGVALVLDASASDDPNGDAIFFNWDMDMDGQYDDLAGETPAFIFSGNGIYQIAVEVSDSDLTDTAQASVTVLDLVPTAVFTYSPVNQYDGLPVQFTDQSTTPWDSITAWSWDFGGQGTSNLQNPTFSFVGHGAYNVTLTVSDSDGSAHTVTQLVTILEFPNDPPVADPGGPYVVDEGLPLLLDASGSTDPENDPLTFAWDLDNDGLFDDAAGATTTYTWTQNGLYPVSVEVFDGRDKDTAQVNVTVSDLAPAAAFDFTPAKAGLGAPIAFTDQSTTPLDAITAWNWVFGSEGTSAQQNPQFAFAAPGFHPVTLTVTDADGSQASVVQSVQVNNPPVGVLGGPYAGDEGTGIVLDASLSSDPDNDPLTFAWDLDNDGQFDDAASDSATYTWAQNGIYPVSVEISDGLDSYNATFNVTVHDLSPTAEFTFAPAVVELGQALAFTDQSVSPVDAIIGWAWAFGNEGAGAAQHPGFTFAGAGQHGVTLTVTDADGSMDTVSRTVTVHSLVAQVAGDTVLVEGGTGNYDASGSVASTPYSVTGYEWDWSYDGAVFAPSGDTGVTASHTFVQDGTAHIAVRATDSLGASHVAALTVTVQNAPPVVQPVPDPQPKEGQPVTFTGVFDDPGVLDTHVIEWDFGDGNTAVGTLAPQHTYANAGDYTVTLKVTDNFGASDVFTFLVKVVPPNLPPVAHAGGPYVVDEGSALQVSALASTDPDNDPLTYAWDLDNDGQFDDAVGAQPSWTWNADGAYIIRVQASDGALQHTAQANVTVNDLGPAAAFIVASGAAKEDEAVTFNDQSTTPVDAIVAWQWDFGGQGQSNIQNPTFTFADPGSYVVTLTVTDADGSTSTTRITLGVDPCPDCNTGSCFVGAIR